MPATARLVSLYQTLGLVYQNSAGSLLGIALHQETIFPVAGRNQYAELVCGCF